VVLMLLITIFFYKEPERDIEGVTLGQKFRDIGIALSDLKLTTLLIILGATDKRAPAGFAPIAIGLGLTLIHLISIPVTNTSVNPARSTGVAVFVGGWAVAQLWMFWIAPIFGGVLGGLVYRWLGRED